MSTVCAFGKPESSRPVPLTLSHESLFPAGLGKAINHRRRTIPDPLVLIRKKAGSGPLDLSLIPGQGR